MSRTFIDVSLLKLKYVNRLKYLPTELIQIIKSFCFIHYKEAQQIRFYQQQKAITNQLIKSAFSRNSAIEEIVYGFGTDWAMALTDTHSNFWIFGFTDNPSVNEERWDFDISSFNYLNRQDLQLQGENCKKCGEYTYLSYRTFTNTHSNMKLCNCGGVDITSSQEWDDGYEWYW